MSSTADSKTFSYTYSLSNKDVAALRARGERQALIIAGALPTTDELLCGMPFCRDDLQADAMAYIDLWKSKRRPNDSFDPVPAAELVRAQADIETIEGLREALEGKVFSLDLQLRHRCDIWLAVLGHQPAKGRVALYAITPRSTSRSSYADNVFRLLFAIGLTNRIGGWKYESGGMEEMVSYGSEHVGKMLPILAGLEDDDSVAEAEAERQAQEFLAAVGMEDGSSAETVGKLEALLPKSKRKSKSVAGMIVVPTMGAGVGGQVNVRKSWSHLAGKHLPIVRRGNIASHRRSLVERWPHAVDVIDAILSDLSASDSVRFRPTLLVGEPGSGKSSLARAICEQVGLPVELSSLAGSSDSSLMGTSAQWSTTRESVTLQLIKRSGKSSVAMIWDEIEKADPGRHNGSSLDALLPMLERDQARRYRDLALEVEVDLSMVSHFATANSLDGIPAPIKDRFRILTMPDPNWSHIGTLSQQIIGRIAKERGIDSRFFGDLAEDEIELIRQAWPGGSIRKLTAIVRTIIDGRDLILPRC